MSNRKYVDRVLELAARGIGRTGTNPLVGACLVDDDTVVAEGAHESYGSDHAERNLLESVDEIPSGSTLYVSLEPCIRHGKTPPCLEALVESGLERYVVVSEDPHPSVNGDGIEALRSLGYAVDLIEDEDRHTWLNRAYLFGVRTGRPWVDLKLATTADGYLATPSGASQWITGETSRAFGHRLRSRVDAVMVGAGTLRSDDPRLTDRETDRDDQPAAIVVVRSDEGIQLSHHLLTERAKETILVVPPDFSPELIEQLNDRGVRFVVGDLYEGEYDWRQVLPLIRREGVGRILAEGGSFLAGSLLEAGVVCETHFFYSGRMFGNGIPAIGASLARTGVKDAPDGILVDCREFDNDVYVRRLQPEALQFFDLNPEDLNEFVDPLPEAMK